MTHFLSLPNENRSVLFVFFRHLSRLLLLTFQSERIQRATVRVEGRDDLLNKSKKSEMNEMLDVLLRRHLTATRFFFFTTPGQPSYGYLPQVVKLRAEIPPSFDGLLPPPSPTFLTAAGRLCNQQHGRCRSSIKATCRSGGCLTCRFASQQTTLDALGSVRNQKLL